MGLQASGGTPATRGHLLGNGGGRVEHESDGTLGSTLLTSYRIGYRLLDLSGLSDLVLLMTVAGIATVGGAYVVLRRRNMSAHDAVGKALLIGLPLLTPLAFAAIAPSVWGVHTAADEDLSYLGVLGGWLALSVPAFVVLLALVSDYNPWLGRFLLVPLAVALPLLAYAWRNPFDLPRGGGVAKLLSAHSLITVVSPSTLGPGAEAVRPPSPTASSRD